MKIVYSEQHKLRDAGTELYGGQLIEPFERPSRMDHILARNEQTKAGPVIAPDEFGIDPILRIHDKDYIAFLQSAWQSWSEAGYKGEAIATTWPARRMAQKVPDHIDGKLGYYSMACETSISEGTWEAAYASAQVALTGAKIVRDGERAAFALCRPPGHHAAYDMYGGYCFLNNAAIAAQYLLDQGLGRVAIVDVDFHHGNGSQDIFYTRSDVLFTSLHGDPRDAFPHFLGYADETGSGDGEGFTFNYPMKPGTRFDEWRSNFSNALNKIGTHNPEALIVSLGVDTFENDPISFFRLQSSDFTTYGADIAGMNLPTLFVMEGGYDIGEIGINALNVIQGFDAACSTS